jgi:histidyl-tRNA synthetase
VRGGAAKTLLSTSAMSKRFQAMRGTRDVLPGEVEAWQALEETARATSSRYGYREIRTPLFEATDLFARGVGESTDIVRREMYTFPDRKGRSVTLRPEGTAGVARALIEAGWTQPGQVHKLFYLGAMFRYDRPQAGRYRQFHQWGAEVVGSASPAADVETILLLVDFLESLGLAGLAVKVNSVGDADCRPRFQERLREALAPHRDSLCADCRERLERNPLRVFDCKVPGCRAIVLGLPSMLEALCDACRAHFAAVRAGLDAAGVRYEVDPALVRGLDYYTRTAYEVHHGEVGAQSAVGGGGRYDGLIHLLGGPEVPAVGFSLGIERTLLALTEEGRAIDRATPAVYVVRGAGLGEDALRLVQALRRRFAVHTDYDDRPFGAQLRHADKLGARVAVILGEDEARAGEVTVKDLTSGEQRRVPRAELEAAIAALLESAAAVVATHPEGPA